jgi:hypothetical protein
MVTTRVARRSLVGCALALVAMALAGASPALASSNHLFDPQLSLTGGCTTDEFDSVQDPSCPYLAFPAGPSEPFVKPGGLAVDTYGDVYVLAGEGEGKEHIDVFDSESAFITELSVGISSQNIAVDSNGYLYVYTQSVLRRYEPTVYDPAAREIAYETAPAVVAEGGSLGAGLAVNPENDHLFVNYGQPANQVDPFQRAAIVEFGSGEAGNPVLDNQVAEVHIAAFFPSLAIDAARDRIYATDQVDAGSPRIIRVFELAPPHNLIETIDGSSTPEGSFVSAFSLSVAADEATGNVFAYDEISLRVIYELSEDGQYLATIEHGISDSTVASSRKQVAVDNGANSPHGALDSEGHYLWATAEAGGIGRAFAFKPSHECPPVVESIFVAHVGEEDALLQAEIEPCQLETSYRFEYVTAQQFAETEFQGASMTEEGTIPAGGVPVGVAAGATGLSPATRYVFRVVATNSLGSDEGEDEFKTYPASPSSTACPNEALRSGPSALLSDCRAYELVTPANTNGLAPVGAGPLGPLFLSLTASPVGDNVSFRIEGGTIPGSEGTGSYSGDPYLARRGTDGWSTVGTGGRGTEFQAVTTGGSSPDQAYSAWTGTVNGAPTTYLRFPDGHSEPLGKGSLGTDPDAGPHWISAGGTHVIFGAGPIEPLVSDGAIYDRTVDGITHLVSLLPGDPTPTEQANFAGASQDGRGIAFTLGSTLYLRYNDEETYDVAEGATYEGVAEGGRRVFYLKEGKLYAFDVEAGTIPFTSAGEATVVNVARDGGAAYFVSPSKLTSTPNPLGAKAKLGKENLYLSQEGQIEFLGTLTERDVAGEGSNVRLDGLGLWSEWVSTIGGLPEDPSRTSYAGGVLVFQSRANLTGYDSGGHSEVYRYDSAANTLACLSCNPTERPALADASLQSIGQDANVFPTWTSDRIENLTSDGRRAFFESTEALVAADVDGLRDVYEWEAQGIGSCSEPAGCLFLVSSGRSPRDDYLYGVSESGNDVFILSNDLLVPGRDPDETRSIYDARVNGGFASAYQVGECLGEACQPAVRPPERPAQVLEGAGNVTEEPKARCPKGKRAVKNRGKTRCVPRHKKHRRHRGANAKRGRSHR